MNVVERNISELIPAEYNPRYISDEALEHLKASIQRFDAVEPVLVNMHPDRKNIIISGHQRLKAAKALGMKKFPCVELNLDKDQERELNIRMNKNTGGWDWDSLSTYFETEELTEWGFTNEELFADAENEDKKENAVGKLTDKFIIPPFSVLDTRQGHWAERKGYWREIIGDNGESREGKLSKSELMSDINNGVSILDPVIAEISNLWFGLPNSKTFDCFAGDSVFGYVSSYLGNEFTGIELRKEQADLNNKRIKGFPSKYICDDGQNVLKHVDKESQDLLFSCPPYFDLEVYSELKNDASNQKDYKDFLQILDNAFTNAIKCLKENRFAVITVGDVRDKKGFYYRFVDDVKDIFKKSDMLLYNELILVETLGTLPQRVGRYMNNRKVGKCHQNILVFYKGDPKKIKSIYPELEIHIDESADIQ